MDIILLKDLEKVGEIDSRNKYQEVVIDLYKDLNLALGKLHLELRNKRINYIKALQT